MEVLRINFGNGNPTIVPKSQLQAKGSRYYFRDTFGLSEGEVFVSPFDLNIEHGEIEQPIKPMIRFGTPVFDSKGKKRGVVLLNYLGINLLETLGILSKNETGAVTLLNDNGFYLRGEHSDDEWGFMYENGKGRTFKADYPDAWLIITQSESGQFPNSDGLFTFTTLRPFTEAQISSTGSSEPCAPSQKLISGSDYHWKLVSFVSTRSLAKQGAESLSILLIVSVSMFVFLLAGSGAIAYARLRRKQAEREVRYQRDHLKQMVEVRTADLTKANDQLQKDMEERKRIAAEKNGLEKQLLQTQKMEAIGTLAGGVAHDFNNMLSVIIGTAEILLDTVAPDGDLRGDIEEILTAANRSKEITRQLLAFARQQTIVPKVLDLNATIESMLKMLRRLIGENIELAWHPKANLWPVKMDPTQIDQILANLCVNARDAIADIGNVSIETNNVSFDEESVAMLRDAAAGDFVVLAVSDDGAGMDQATQNRAFDPFFTTKALGRGTGLGLSTVYGIVKQNNGFVHLYSEPGEGTTIRIYLPKHTGTVVEDTDRHVEKIPKGRGETVMVVEDDLPTLRLIRRILERAGYRVVAANGPNMALQWVSENAEGIDLLITDVVMPEMNGRELADRLHEHFPGIKCLFMSGYTADVIADRGVLEEGFTLIQKPFSRHELEAIVSAALNL